MASVVDTNSLLVGIQSLLIDISDRLTVLETRSKKQEQTLTELKDEMIDNFDEVKELLEEVLEDDCDDCDECGDDCDCDCHSDDESERRQD